MGFSGHIKPAQCYRLELRMKLSAIALSFILIKKSDTIIQYRILIVFQNPLFPFQSSVFSAALNLIPITLPLIFLIVRPITQK